MNVKGGKLFHSIMTGEVLSLVEGWWIQFGSGKQIFLHAQRPREK